MSASSSTITQGSTASGSGRAPWRRFFKGLGIAALVLVGTGAGAGMYLHSKFTQTDGIIDNVKQLFASTHAMIDPRGAFPGQDRITVLCLGLDRNIYRSKDPKLNGMPYTTGARSDVMMVASLDLRSQSVSILSIPRDTRVKLPGRRGYDKINAAHSEGGIPYTRETVQEFLGVPVDYHVVIKQEAIQAIVDALGGVKVKVDHDMDYDDSWGNLHIHLKEGEQVLDGMQTVGFMRFRHDAFGDFGRIKRQQQVIQALAEKVKDPRVILKAGKLIDAVHDYVKSDLSPKQQLALAHLFHKVDPANVVTAQLPGDATDIDGVSYVLTDDEKKEAVVDWIVRGNAESMNKLIRVDLRNASGDPELYQKVYRYLRSAGFDARRRGRASEEAPASRVVQRTNLKGSGRRVLEVLGLTGSVEKLDESGSDVTLYVGKDLADSAVLAFADTLPDVPEQVDRTPTYAREGRRSRRRRDSARVTIRRPTASSEEEETTAPAEEPQTLDVPGSADPQPESTPVPSAPESTPSAPSQPATPDTPGTGAGEGAGEGQEEAAS